jgi:acyl-CoA synthetase (AMP-forming)/AMP-acid ligase II
MSEGVLTGTERPMSARAPWVSGGDPESDGPSRADIRRSPRHPGPGYEPTIPNLLRHIVARHGDRPFLIDGDRELTFAQAAAESTGIARGLMSLGVGKGTRVGLLMPNSIEWVLTWLAAARLGALTVGVSTFGQERELSWMLRHTDIAVLIAAPTYLRNNYVARLEGALPALAEQKGDPLYLPTHPYLRHIAVLGPCDRDWALAGRDVLRRLGEEDARVDADLVAAVEENVSPADDLVVVSTSGTTQEPKSVVHTHGAAIRTTHAFLDYLDVTPDDRTYTGYQFFWTAGLNSNLLTMMHLGGSLVFAPSPRPSDVLAMIERARVTRVTVHVTTRSALRAAMAEGNWDTSSVRTGLDAPRDEYGREIPLARRFCNGTGLGLGMSETFGMHSIEKCMCATPIGKEGNWGRHLPGIDRRIVDPQTGAGAPVGTAGELYVRGYSLLREYYKKEREDTFTRDGFFPTGDRCLIDEDGYLYFLGRMSEMIKTAGANVAPREVEVALQRYEEVREAVVLGLPDEERGEAVVAVVVPSGGAEVEAGGLRTKLRADLSAYKVPTEIIEMAYEEIPRTDMGKVRKSDLREMLIARRA